MSNETMTSLVESLQRRRTVRRTLASFSTSLLLQALVAAVLILVPLMATDTLPAPREVASVMMTPTLKVEPPVRRIPSARTVKAGTAISVPQGMLVAPMEIPQEVGEIVDFFEPAALPPVGPVDVLGRRVATSDATPREPESREPVRVGGHIEPPNRTLYVAPVYPEVARKARVQGWVILEAVLDSEGNVTNLKVLRSVPLLDQAAIDAVRQWRYEPTLLNGVPVPIVMTITVRFVLE